MPNISLVDESKDSEFSNFIGNGLYLISYSRRKKALLVFFFYEVYQCICATEIRTADEFLSRAKLIIPMTFLLCLVMTGLQEAGKYLLMNVLETESLIVTFVDLGAVHSITILLAMIYMTAQIVVSLTKAARFRNQSNPAARGKGGFSNFLYFLPFVILASHVFIQSIDIVENVGNLLLTQKLRECMTKWLEGLQNEFATNVDLDTTFYESVNELSCPSDGLANMKSYAIRFYCSAIECCYVLLHTIRKKIAEKEK